VPSKAPLGRFWRAAALLGVLLLLGAGTALPAAHAAGAPPLPVALDRSFVENLTGSEVSPGGAGTITLNVHDPLGASMSDTVLTLGVYAFNAFPGNATSEVDIASAPVLLNASASGLEVNVSLGTLAAGEVEPLSVSVQSGDSTPSGTFAVRTALLFSENGSSYRLASRGWFTAAQWSAATSGPNGTVDVNLTALGVSGILPETSILVSSNDFSYVLGGLLAAGVVLVAAGAWLYFRRSNSRAGT
jgi:hypothetical protein